MSGVTSGGQTNAQVQVMRYQTCSPIAPALFIFYNARQGQNKKENVSELHQRSELMSTSLPDRAWLILLLPPPSPRPRSGDGDASYDHPAHGGGGETTKEGTGLRMRQLPKGGSLARRRFGRRRRRRQRTRPRRSRRQRRRRRPDFDPPAFLRFSSSDFS